MYKKYQLKNGLTVLLVESHKSPVVSVQMWVRTGSADEQKGEEGLSHFIEHLVFKGTRKFGVGEIASTIEGSGGQLNAYTSFDQTVFYVTISKNFMDTGLEAISEMMGFPLFDEKEIDNEREVVIEEIKRGIDNPHRQASRQLFSTVYKKHPYRLPVIGFAENIRKVSKSKIEEYYQKRYVPENMTLLVVGDFSSKSAKEKVKDYFSDFKPYKLKKIKRDKEPKQERARISVKKTDFKESLLYISWPVPKVKHKDIPALDVMSLILGQGDSSRLSKKIKLDKGLVNHIGASSFTPQDDGFLAISASTSPKRIDETLSETVTVLEEFLSEPPTAEEMKKALVNFNSEEFYSMETVDGMASKVGTYEHLFKDYRHFKEFMKQVNSLTPKDILKVARKYIKPESMSLVLMTPSAEDEGKKSLRTFAKSFKKMRQNIKSNMKVAEASNSKFAKIKWSGRLNKGAKSKEDQIERLKLPNGGIAYFRPDFSTNVISIKSAFMGGVRVEPDGKEGLTDLLSSTWGRSTEQDLEHELSVKIDSLASSLSAFAGRNTLGLSSTTLGPFVNEIFEIYKEIISKPVFEEVVVEREKVMMLEQLKMRDDNPAQIAIQDFHSRIFKGHPYSKDMRGTPESIKGFSGKDIRGLLNTSISSKNMKTVVAGNFDLDEWKGKISDFSKILKSGKRIENKFEVEKRTESEKSFIKSKKEQSHIIVGYSGLTFTSEERFTLQLIQSILAGQGGRLFLELRDKESLAYSVAPLRMEGIDAGYFGAYIGCSPEKGKKAIEMMKVEFEKLMNDSIDEAELTRSKRYLIGRHDIDLQKTSSVATAILFDTMYGLDPEEPFCFGEKIDTVTASDIRDLAQKIFSQPEVAICVGSEAPWG